jgi:DnaD/phage-associated family protein
MTPIPEAFYTDLLTAIDDLSELKLILLAFHILSRREASVRYLRREDFLAHPGWGEKSPADLDTALNAAVQRGTLLEARVELDQGAESLYFLNTPRGRAAAQGVRAGDWTPGTAAGEPVALAPERPSIFQLYEENLGALTPMIAESLREAEETYPASWIEDAVRIAVDNNVRKWSYVRAVLEGWRTRGRDDRENRGDSEKARRRYLKGS